MSQAFTFSGSPEEIRARAAVTRTKGQSFIEVGSALTRVATDGWTGRAADRFRDRFEPEPDRWQSAGAGFLTAAGALEAYADELGAAQQSAADAAGEYARGEQVTRDARAAYDADVSRARNEAATLQAQGTQVTLTIEPFADPGQAVRDGAVASFAQAERALDAAAHECASQVRAGCAAAPHKRNWLESGAAFAGGVVHGAGEASWDLAKLANAPLWSAPDLLDVATGHLTLEELAAKQESTATQAAGLVSAVRTDPAGFGKNVGRAVLDLDTWADDPARAVGHLVPDAVITVASGGAGAGVKAAEGAAALAQGGVLATGSAGILRRGVWDALKDAKVIYATTPAGVQVPAGYDVKALRDLILEARVRPEDLPPGLRKTYERLGKLPRNGMKHHEGELVELPPALKAKYPKGVRFTPEGFPDFTPYARKIVSPTEWGPTRTADAARASKLAGLAKTPEGWVWHHAEDGTMQLIPFDLHRKVQHTGGVALNKKSGVHYRD